jgi:3,4-dihydroxy 2-butanone 4-phosphate synthase/GTP cyclohydrolase II
MMKAASNSPFDPIPNALQAIAEGRLIIVTDDEERENEGDLVMAAERATPETINMMIRHARGLICVPALEPQLRRLGISQMVSHNRESQRTDFSVSVDAAKGITTGISAYDRALTIRLLADATTTPESLVQPGHIFPLRARPGGVLERAGHTEAAVDLVSLSGLHPVGVICEILNEDGSCARLPDLIDFKQRFNLPMISINQLIEYRLKSESLIESLSSEPFETDAGPFQLNVFRNRLDASLHYALTLGDVAGEDPVLVRMHASSLLEDLFQGNLAESSGHGLQRALRRIQEAGRGVLVYLDRRAMTDQNSGASADRNPSATTDFRAHGIGTQILARLGVRRIRLLTSTPRRVVGLEGYGLCIEETLKL